MDEAARDQLRTELNRIWVQSVVKPYTKANLHYWHSQLKKNIKKLRDNGHPDDAYICNLMELTLFRLNRALGVLSRA